MAPPIHLNPRPDNKNLRLGCLALSAILVISTVICSGLIGLGTFAAHPGAFVIATILASMTAVPYFFFLRWLDRNEPEPWSILFAAFFWGAFVATAISYVVNTTTGMVLFGVTGSEEAAGFLTASLSAPFIEEITKGLALLAIFLIYRKEFDNLLDGIL